MDIHGGGRDLIFPHHENEIAQSEAATNKTFVKYWLHNGFVTVNREKMSKSLGNFFLIREILEMYDPEVVRLFLVSAHYRSNIDFSDQQLEQSKKSLERIHHALDYTRVPIEDESQLTLDTLNDEEKEFQNQIDSTYQNFIDAMDDDFNTPKALASIFDLAKRINSLAETDHDINDILLWKTHQMILQLGNVFGLFQTRMSIDEAEKLIAKLINLIIDIRQDAREKKDWKIADAIRDKLATLGIELQDYARRVVWSKKEFF